MCPKSVRHAPFPTRVIPIRVHGSVQVFISNPHQFRGAIIRAEFHQSTPIYTWVRGAVTPVGSIAAIFR